MNVIWTILMAIGTVGLLLTSPQDFLPLVAEAGQQTISLASSLIVVFLFWQGLTQILLDCGAVEAMSKGFAPLSNKLFGKQDNKTQQLVSANIVANLIGVGSAATPPAIDAIANMNKNGKMTRGMAMLFVLNSSSVQLIPTTIVGLRFSMGSSTPSDIILPSLVASFIVTAVGIFLTHICYPR